ncbi:peptide chain release factor 2-like isoform X2 [Arvicola amphibius]|uniref:peptide chain release factor 2-like isoform X2 n=1 Tax=Arvicola amphibius TaxID=1047088 RepID=UPI0018E38204|nr:peptide chain release factor 2-like isoform X2 [Arvicola amphibius]
MGEGAARRPAVCEAPAVSQAPPAGAGGPTPGSTGSRDRRVRSPGGGQAPRLPPPPATQKTGKGDRGVRVSSDPGRAKAGEKQSLGHCDRNRRGRAARTQRRAPPLPGGGGAKGLKAARRREPRKRGRERYEKASAPAAAPSTRARGGRGRSPRALASSRDRRPSPTQLARSLSLTRRRRRLRRGEVLPQLLLESPNPSGPEAAASPVRKPQPPPRSLPQGPQRASTAPLAPRLDRAARQHDRVRQHAITRAAGPSGSRSALCAGVGATRFSKSK